MKPDKDLGTVKLIDQDKLLVNIEGEEADEFYIYDFKSAEPIKQVPLPIEGEVKDMLVEYANPVMFYKLKAH